jgi:hypothetical protein
MVKLKVELTGNKVTKYHYTVMSESGEIVSERRSNREYVACTENGEFYFGRLDLIGKGDHGRKIRNYQEQIKNPLDSYRRYLSCARVPAMQFDEYTKRITEDSEKILKKLNSIAYK